MLYIIFIKHKEAVEAFACYMHKSVKINNMPNNA